MGLKPAAAAEKILSHSLSVLKEATNLVLSSYQNTLVAVLLLQSSDKSNIFFKSSHYTYSFNTISNDNIFSISKKIKSIICSVIH